MGREVDQRVVEMQFNNGSFERNCKETLSTLDRLKDALKFDGVGSSIESVEAKFSTLQLVAANVLSDIASKAIDAGAKIAKALSVDQLVAGWSKYDAAIASEQKIMSSVSEKINSETGELFTLDDVTKRIEKLQWYTDETSYNIDQMTNAIGDFTASGVDLDVAVDAIFGISNACADAGITAEQAASAYIGFAKAIGSGKMSLGIWSQQLKTSGITNSERFRQSLFEAIKANSKLIKTNKKTGKSYIQVKKGKEVVEEEISATNFEQYFKEGIATTDSILQALKSYSDTVSSLYGLTNGGQLDISSEVIQKLTKEIEKQGKTLDDYGLAEEYDTASEAIRALTKAYEELGLEVPKSLKAFARAQEAISFSQAIESVKVAMSSGMSKSFELLFGNYETAKSLWTELANDLYDVFVTAGNTRNEILSIWKDRGGQELFIEALKTIFQDFVVIKEAVDEGIKKVFPGLYDVEGLVTRLMKLTRKFSVRVQEISDSLNDTKNVDSLYNKIIKYSEKVSKVISDIITVTKKVWTAISPTLKKAVDVSGEIVKTIIGAISKIKNRFVADFPKIKQTISDTISEFTGSDSGKQFIETANKVKDFIKTIYDEFKKLEWVDTVYDGFVSVIKVGYKVIVAVAKGIVKVFNFIVSAIETVSDFISSFSEDVSKNGFGSAIKTQFEKIQNGVNSVVDSVKNASVISTITDLWSKFIDKVKIGWNWLADNVFPWLKTAGSAISKTFNQIGTSISGFIKNISKSKFVTVLKTIAIKVGDCVKSIYDSIVNLNAAQNLWDSFVGVIKAGWNLLVNIFKTIFNLISSLFSGINESLQNGSLADNIKLFIGLLLALDLGKLLMNINTGITSFAKGLQEAMWYLEADSMLDFAKAMFIFVAAVTILSAIDTEKLAAATIALGALFTEIAIAFNVLYGLDSESVKKSLTNIGDSFAFKVQMSGIKSLINAVLSLSIAALILSSIDAEKLDYSMACITAFIWQLVLVAKALGNGKTDLVKGTKGLIAFSAAIFVLAIIAKIISKMDFSELAKGGLGLLGLSTILVASAAILGSKKIEAFDMSSLIKFTAAMAILLIIAKIISKMSWEELAKAGSGLLGLSAILVASAAVLGNEKIKSFDMAPLIKFAAALAIMIVFAKILGKMEWDELAKAGAGLLGLSIILVASASILGNKKIASFDTKPLLVFSAAIAIMAIIAKMLGNMSWSQLAKAGVGLLGIAAILVATAVILGSAKAMAVEAAAAMLVMSLAFAILVPSLMTLSLLGWEGLAIGLVGLAGAFTVFGLAGLVLGPLAPVLIAISAAVALFGAGLFLTAASLSLAAAGLAALSVSFTAFGAAFALNGAIVLAGLESILKAAIALIPEMIIAFGQGVLDILQFFSDNGPVIKDSVVGILTSLLDAVIELIPKIIDLVITIITEVCRSLDECIPVMVETAIGMLLAMLQGIADNIEEVVATALDVVTGFLNGIADGIGDVIQAGVNLCLSFIEGIADAFDNEENHKRLKDALLKLLKGIIKTVLGGWELLQTIGKEAAETGKNIINGIKKGVEDAAKKLIESVKDVAKQAWEGVKSFLGISSPSKLFAEVGKYTVLGMSKGIDDNSHYAEDSAEEMARGSFDTVASVMSKISDAVDSNMDITPTITPLVDISDIEKKASGINNLLGGSYGIDGSLNLASKTAGGFNIMAASKNGSGLADDDMYVANTSQSINNTFNITGDNPKEIAQEVSRILAKQVERKQASWA